MGKDSKKTNSNISNTGGTKEVLQEFEEEGSDFLDNPVSGCIYLGKEWNGFNHQIFTVVIPQQKIPALYDLICYKFGVLNITKKKFYYFVWSGTSDRKEVKNISEDSKRFWRTIIMLLRNTKDE